MAAVEIIPAPPTQANTGRKGRLVRGKRIASTAANPRMSPGRKTLRFQGCDQREEMHCWRFPNEFYLPLQKGRKLAQGENPSDGFCPPRIWFRQIADSTARCRYK